MKPTNTSFLLILFFCFFSATASFGHDTDLYMGNGEGVEPNILIIFDNSGSMNEEVQAYFYDPSTTYDPGVIPVVKRDAVYYNKGSDQWGLFKNSIAEVDCADARDALTSQGHYEGKADSGCRGKNRVLRTGNYRNYLASVGGEETLPKLAIAKKVIIDFLNTVHGARVGVMVFNSDQGGHIQSTIESLTGLARTQLTYDIDRIVGQTYTPLAETLYEAGLYFKGGSSYFNSGVVYTSPIQYHCQNNFVAIITDGEPTKDRDPILATVVGDRNGDGREPKGAHEVHYESDGSDYLDDVAKYLYDTDLSSSLEARQNILTHTIGFAVSSDLLERTAAEGHGRYYYSTNAQSLSNAFQNVINDILTKTSSFVAPIVPVSRMERTSAGDKIYLALFKPKQNESWSGNIKKFSVAQENDPALDISTGDLVDASGRKAVDSVGQILNTSRSFWTSSGTLDGPDVEKGGLGEVLMRRSSARNIYTYLGNTINLAHSSNEFSLSNNLITPAALGLASGDSSGRDKLIKFVHGYDAYDDNGNGSTDEKRDWILGSFLHSRPVVVHYGETQSVIFGGSNDGMLHAFDDATGEELWAFIPPNLLTKLQALHQDVIQSFVDGSPKVYLGSDREVLVFGERRGGDRYYALDITDCASPKFLWEIGPSMPGYEELGQTWSTPQFGKIRYGSDEKWVAFIGGGYDENQDNETITAADSKGRAIYAFDALTGSEIWRYSYAQNAEMTYSIPSDISRIDTNSDGKTDRLYVGDMGGRVWRFDVVDPNPANWTGKIIFKSNTGSGDQRKIFYPPDVVLESEGGVNYETLLFGTGDREHPKESTTINRLYAVKDKNPSTAMTENELVDVTSDLLQDPSTPQTQKETLLSQLKEKGGWYIKLNLNAGEKSLASPVVYYKTVYYTTFAPTFGNEVDPCFVGEGTARLYILNYRTGNAAFNLDASNDAEGPTIGRTDRSGIIGTAIPSGVIITFIRGLAVGYAGVGGGVYAPPLPSTRSLVPIQWRIVD
jgi:type IV pilus assembly protein PilY1